MILMVQPLLAQHYEYWIDNCYNERKIATRNGNISNSIDVSSLKYGLHFYNIRIQDEEGVWGPVYRYMFLVTEKIQLEPAAVEYWIDDKSSVVQAMSGSTIQLFADISQLETGLHDFNCRVQATNGTWSEIHSEKFTIEAPADKDAFVEYFIDKDPGYGKGTILKGIALEGSTFNIDLANTTSGAHTLYIRTRDEQGNWSSTVSRPLYVRRPVNAVALEYFIDNDPGVGSGVALPPPEDISEPYSFAIPMKELAVGQHFFGIRAKGSDGLWTYCSRKAFNIVELIGDANSDGTINAADIVEVVNYIMGCPSAKFNKSAADANGDGTVNATDIVKIVNIIMGN